MSRATAAPERAAGAASTATRPRRRRAVAWLALALAAVVATHAAFGAAAFALVGSIVNAVLAALFAATLRRGREPMITLFARAERGTLEPDLVAYTRALTWVWVAFFAVAAIVSGALSRFATPSIAAAIAGANWIGVAALFVGEWAYRRRRFRHYHHASPLALARIVFARWREGLVR